MAATYEDPRAHAVRERYLTTFGGPELPVPVEAIAEDLLGLRVEERPALGLSGMLLPAERRVVVNADEVAPRRRFTLAHELGHWVCQVREGAALPVYCRVEDVAESADRALEREANIFAAELLMPEPAVRRVWEELVAQSHELREAVAACARRFDVSPTAMQWRLYGFGLAAAAPRRLDS